MTVVVAVVGLTVDETGEYSVASEAVKRSSPKAAAGKALGWWVKKASPVPLRERHGAGEGAVGWAEKRNSGTRPTPRGAPSYSDNGPEGNLDFSLGHRGSDM